MTYASRMQAFVASATMIAAAYHQAATAGTADARSRADNLADEFLTDFSAFALQIEEDQNRPACWREIDAIASTARRAKFGPDDARLLLRSWRAIESECAELVTALSSVR